MPERDDVIVDEGDLRWYRTEVPNMLDDSTLSPHARALYLHYKRVCGADGGVCREGTRTTAQKTRMSTGAVVKAKRELQTNRWVRVEPGDPQKNEADTVTIVDVWLANFKKYDAMRREKAKKSGVHNMHTPCSHSAHPCSYCERKKEPLEESVSHTRAGAKGSRKAKKFDDRPELPMPDEFKALTDELREAAAAVLGDDWSSLVDVRVEHIAWVARAESQGVLQKDWRAAWRMWLTLAIKRERDKGVQPATAREGASAGGGEETLETRLRRRASSTRETSNDAK